VISLEVSVHTFYIYHNLLYIANCSFLPIQNHTILRPLLNRSRMEQGSQIPDLLASVNFTDVKPAIQLAAEVEEGNHEYKFKLSNLSESQVNHRISQLQWRLNEGSDEAYYHIGVEDDGNPLGLSEEDMRESLKTLQYMAEKADCDMVVSQLFAGEQGFTAEVIMRRRKRLTLDTNQLNIAMCGDVDSGKSSLIGVLCSGRLDNGKGLARATVFTHNHEVETGRTSSISHNLIHFGKDGEVSLSLF
jgi:GTPase